MQGLITKIIPILLLILFGYYIREGKIIESKSMQGVRDIVIKVAVPLLLFKIFLTMELKKEYIWVVFTMMVFFFISYIAGKLLFSLKIFNYRLLPYVTTSFAFGLLAVPLFQGVFGESSLGAISVLGIAQELFVWIFLVSILRFEFNNEKISLRSVYKVITTPLILCVLLGVVLNILNVDVLIQKNFILKGVYDSVDSLSSVVSPLLLVIVGYGLVIKKHYLKKAVKFVFVRVLVVFTFGYAAKIFILDRIINDQLFDYAFFIFLILPPNLSIHVVASEYCEKDEFELSNNIVAVSIIICLISFLCFTIFII